MLFDQQYRARQLSYETAYPDADHDVTTQAGKVAGPVTSTLRLDDGPSLHVVDIAMAAAARGDSTSGSV